MNADVHVCTGRGEGCLCFRDKWEDHVSPLVLLPSMWHFQMSQGPLLTVLTAPHGGAKDGGIFSVVERVAIPVHWMVEKCEVPTEERKGSERAGLGLGPWVSRLKSGGTALMGKAFLWDDG